jgi:lysophospholipase L1-like esterase
VQARRGAAGLGLALLLLVGAACGSDASSPSSQAAGPPAPGSTPSASRTPAAPPTGSPDQIYVSVGDSYASGYQPTAPRVGSNTRNGFAYQVVDASKAKGYDLRLTNFGCGGATTVSVLESPGCREEGLAPDANQYAPATQAAAAEQFLRDNRGQVALITVSIGGNDVTACGKAEDAVKCVSDAVGSIKTNLSRLLRGLRDAAGPQTRIVGITYPDVLLGDYLSPDPAKKRTAELSVVAFKSLINPALKAEYEAVGGKFVDVTDATGAYTPLTQTTELAPYGRIPVPVAKVCRLTYYCEFTDIHPRTEGYSLISDLVVGTLPKR